MNHGVNHASADSLADMDYATAKGLVHGMRVVKRDDRVVPFSFDAIVRRMQEVGTNLKHRPVLDLNYQQLVCDIGGQLHDLMHTSDIDEVSARQCMSQAWESVQYEQLASRLLVSNHHKNTSSSFAETTRALAKHCDGHGRPRPLVNAEYAAFVERHAHALDAMVDYDRDYDFTPFGFKTLMKAYLIHVHGRVVERPQHMYLRVAVALYKPLYRWEHTPEGEQAALARIRACYDELSRRLYTHATPTLFNAGSNVQQLSSCFLVAMKDDSLAGIYDTLKQCAEISKHAGGIGMHVHNIRAQGTPIASTNGTSNGLLPMLRVFDGSAAYVDQGGGKRNGSIAVYLEPWHADVWDFVALRNATRAEKQRTLDLFIALWVPDLFMERVEQDAQWSLFCPHKCPGLSDVYGEEFRALYTRYEAEGRANRTLPARALYEHIAVNQAAWSMPYMLFKDAVNRKNNQANLGVIRSSNLCCEVMEYSSPEETAVCNLAALALPAYVRPDATFDFEALHAATKCLVRNLNRVIDVNYYPTPECARSNLRHRPIGIGVAGLADVFAQLRYPFTSPEAKALNRDLFETIYHAAVETSVELAQELRERALDASDLPHEADSVLFGTQFAGAYSSFVGSPASEGKLQFDLWGVDPGTRRYDWPALKARVVAGGMRNSLLVAPMPTASTSQILGVHECFEPFTSNVFTRRVNAGEFTVVNRHLEADLVQLGLWTPDIRNRIVADRGSIQKIEEIPAHIRELYKTVWEYKIVDLLDMARDRGCFVDQSQSMNLYMGDEPDKTQKIARIHMHAWRNGLKTGLYYMRHSKQTKPQQFTIDPTLVVAAPKPATTCTDECTSCSV